LRSSNTKIKLKQKIVNTKNKIFLNVNEIIAKFLESLNTKIKNIKNLKCESPIMNAKSKIFKF